jgi:catechol 2,3-dioxygenase-like lactoylglutathione lyase family enzyme
MTRFTSITPNLIVRDIAASTAFYRDVLGFAVKQTVPDAAPFVFVWLERDGVPVFLNDLKAIAAELSGAADRSAGGTAGMYFVISGVDELHEAVAPRAKVVMALTNQFYGMREFSIVDLDDHIITFAERVAG